MNSTVNIRESILGELDSKIKAVTQKGRHTTYNSKIRKVLN